MHVLSGMNARKKHHPLPSDMTTLLQATEMALHDLATMHGLRAADAVAPKETFWINSRRTLRKRRPALVTFAGRYGRIVGYERRL
jgi:hypothetical protein